MIRACMQCSSALSGDEVALNRKLISRSVKDCRCLTCLSSYFSVRREQLEDLIEYYHKSGTCILFAKEET
ncbi:MAG: hypothetical protein Q4B03_08850 [Lachnospiraceae bacterium]|nr:hypothetical protein [Lachnospiraceae bacterium]